MASLNPRRREGENHIVVRDRYSVFLLGIPTEHPGRTIRTDTGSMRFEIPQIDSESLLPRWQKRDKKGVHLLGALGSSEFSNGVALGNSSIINTWKPELNRGVSDFDTTHLFTVDWVYQLPVGKGASYLSNANTFVNALLGGWQLSGILRTTSALPFTLGEPGWTTHWQQGGYGTVTGNVKTGRHFDQNGNPQFLKDPDAINNGLNTGGPVRLPYPGEVGQRNNFRGDGVFDLDSGLAKRWSFGDHGGLKFAWEVYNVTNTMRFDVPTNLQSQLTSGTLGISNTLLGPPRRMQFSLRYDF
jgi:hypothetical protein